MSHDWLIGYCTNVHAGTDIDQIQRNLDTISREVLQRLGRAEMGVGLWIPAEASSSLMAPGRAEQFRDWLAERALVPFTINGFPYGNFHQPVVKHRVYQPAWWEPERVQYTQDLATILDRLLPPGAGGSISTLPLGWGTPQPAEEQLALAAKGLKDLAHHLEQIESASGRRITIAIEPEPGCVIDMTSDMIALFDRFLADPVSRRYITVCHDVCHAAVMFERQADVVNQYAEAGIGIGKVQVSSAIDVAWDQMRPPARREAVEQLREFAEDRYLHQTGVVRHDGTQELVEDLPQLLEDMGDVASEAFDRKWCIHFHVPIYLQRFGQLSGTRDAVQDCLQALATSDVDFSGHLEAETYAWGVVPEEIAVENLADGIANELSWLYEQIEAKEAS